MLNRRLVAVASAIVATAVAIAPAHAAKPKKKPKPIKGSYSLTLLPDPTPDAFNTVAPGPGCQGVSPAGKDDHAFTVPAAGTLQVVLDSPDATGTGTFDWDLHILDADGSEISASTGGTAHEETADKFKKKQPVTIEVCNLAGQPSGTVSFTFTYA